ncbi:adenylate/guanylate cyclase domain-containing protein [Bradyrhizobium sp. LVM 105]|uniref:adenylate/guanylate cyclase domain-containing protein n=1 Tax=Bradyrhizobium sp. LVM 105 TaxID=2341115 RepID=UPI000F805217|nr:adenylate/guanylate cyclase domain-containing protein [Bradyrhizobium sp. LVM 105]RTE93947.1 adenylate/guanylate cyclase domain-containing protein [Bradyrhizobium sp. LVM 105]
MDIAEWLRGLGLERYTQAFQDAEVTPDVLQELTEADLRELGLPLGPRKTVLKAIQARSSSIAAALIGAGEPAGQVRPLLPSEADRRQLTVMFVDLVGSTALASGRDPEEVREFMQAYHNTVAGEIARFEGHIAKFLGDGVLAYFGWPRAHEDEAERAIRAGLRVTKAVASLTGPGGLALAARVGIATGLVVVGELVGEGEARERAVIGETPNLAARLQGLAEPGDVVIAESTRRLLGEAFMYRDLGTVPLKGFPGPVQAWLVTGEGEAESRFDAQHGMATTALIGRDQELALLLDRWERAKEREGQIVLLGGEAGIGKSRLVRALRDHLAGAPHTPLSHFCSPFHANTALYPVIGLLERAAGIRREDAPEEQLDKLEAMLALATSDVHESAPVLADLLAVPAGGRYPPLALSPHQKKERTFQALLEQIQGLSARQPLLAIYEDVHWADPTMLEFLDRAVDEVQGLPILMIITFRPEFLSRWTGHGHVTALSLSRLGRRQGAAVVDRVTGGKMLPQEVLEQILAKTDGVPLFVEELTKAVIESGLLKDHGSHYELIGPLPPLAIPTTLQDSLMARLDRLAPVKEVAQIAACIGREFGHDLLRSVTALDEHALQRALNELLTAELIFRRGAPPDIGYSFKHALVQDIAHESLLKGKRQQIHARIAAALEEHYPARAEAEPETIASHFTQGGLAGKAVGYWLRAGRIAAERSANLEAITHLTRGLEALKSSPQGPERDRQELALQTAIGGPLIAIHGYTAPQLGTAFSRAHALCYELDDTGALFATLSGKFIFHFVRGDFGAMQILVAEAQRAAERTGDTALDLAAHRMAALTAMHAGDFLTARSEFEMILSRYQPDTHRPPPVHYVHDPKASALPYLAIVLWMLGYPEQAQRTSRAAFEYAAELNQTNLTAHVQVYGGAGPAELMGDTAAVHAHADAIIDLADQHSLNYWRLSGLILRGWAMAKEGNVQGGLPLMRLSLNERARLGASWYQVRYLWMLAAMYRQLGDDENGLATLAEAKAIAARNEEHIWEAELACIDGELRRIGGASAEEAENCLQAALIIAQRQSAKSFELRAAMSLARLWRDQGRVADARGLLGSVYGWFTEGFETADLRSAKALMQELAEV